jgi:hypothetical protein
LLENPSALEIHFFVIFVQSSNTSRPYKWINESIGYKFLFVLTVLPRFKSSLDTAYNL